MPPPSDDKNPEFVSISLTEKQPDVLLDLYLNVRLSDSRDLVAIYGWDVLLELGRLGLIVSEQRGETTDFFLTGPGQELAEILDHEKRGAQYARPYLRVPIPGGWSD
jgi:hypothetical protein